MCLVYHNKGFTESAGRGSLWAEPPDGPALPFRDSESQ